MISNMRELTLLITINRPTEEVFAFVTNPNNTPKWIEAIDHEEVNESPIKLGTIYRNRSSNGKWSEYQMTSFEPKKKSPDWATIPILVRFWWSCRTPPFYGSINHLLEGLIVVHPAAPSISTFI